MQENTMAVVHVFKTVKCKSCGSQIEIEYLGPSVDLRIAGTIQNPGHMRCPDCGASHKYENSDMSFTVKDQPSKKR